MDNLQQKFHGNFSDEQSDKEIHSSDTYMDNKDLLQSINAVEFTLRIPRADSDICGLEYGSDNENRSVVSKKADISAPPEEESFRNVNEAVTTDSIDMKSGEIDVFRDISDDTLKELEEAFELFDLNADGLITHSDLKRTFVTLGLNVADEDVTKMLAEGSKPLDLEGFVKMVGGKVVQMDPEDVLVDALSKWDYDKTGLIPLSRLRQDLMSSGDRFTEAEVEWALEEAPTITRKGVTMIEYRDFCRSLCSMRKNVL